MKTTLLYLAPVLIAAVAALTAVFPVSAEVAPTAQAAVSCLDEVAGAQ